jgi:hypothetical protein
MNNLTLFTNLGLEIIIDTISGEAFCSQAAYCRMSGASKSTVSSRIKGVREGEIKELEILTGGGLQRSKGIPFALCLDFLAEDNPNLIVPLIDLVYSKTGKSYFLPMITKKKNIKYKYTEKKAQMKLATELNGLTEVYCKTGIIDILTDKEIIEVKKPESWKAAIGQVLVYQLEYPDRQARIHICGKCSEEFKQMVISFSAKLNVIATFVE